jgi:hypothetical protein
VATELLKIKKYEFSDGTVVYVKIDFAKNKVSLVDQNGANYKWLFAERGAEYMNGWLNILGAMRYVIREARDELEAWQKDQDDKKQKQIIDIMVALAEDKE